MAADKQVTLQELASHTEKVLRRGKKLEKSLLKLVAQSDPGSVAEEFLKSVQQSLKKFKKEAKKVGRPLPPETAKAPARKKQAPEPAPVAQEPKRPVSRSRKKAPATPETASNSKSPKA
ncbi:hypothetical protein IC232_12515 [Microvirga sp. BT688]|uniref:hypothetical protein n=1 Tax=Microvirga sp. TaxID=1873136 RepID=UPI00168824F0|nr:hypothetical protein [Microvirga sp.]MBD2747519.1 hypothetical protein [Microvirga sp.]